MNCKLCGSEFTSVEDPFNQLVCKTCAPVVEKLQGFVDGTFSWEIALQSIEMVFGPFARALVEKQYSKMADVLIGVRYKQAKDAKIVAQQLLNFEPNQVSEEDEYADSKSD